MSENTKQIAEEAIVDMQETIITNYYVFSPHEFVFKQKQADSNGLYSCEEGSEEDKVCKIRKGFALSHYIRELNFVSAESVEIILGRVTEKAEKLEKENKELREKLQKNVVEKVEKAKETLKVTEKAEKLEKEKITPKKK